MCAKSNVLPQCELYLFVYVFYHSLRWLSCCYPVGFFAFETLNNRSLSLLLATNNLYNNKTNLPPSSVLFTSCSPVIQLRSYEHVPLTHASLSAAKSAPGAIQSLHRVDTSGMVSVFDAADLARSSSPTNSVSGDSDKSVASVSSGSTPPGSKVSVIKMGDRWQSPTSSLANIYASKQATSAQRKGWRYVVLCSPSLSLSRRMGSCSNARNFSASTSHGGGRVFIALFSS